MIQKIHNFLSILRCFSTRPTPVRVLTPVGVAKRPATLKSSNATWWTTMDSSWCQVVQPQCVYTTNISDPQVTKIKWGDWTYRVFLFRDAHPHREVLRRGRRNYFRVADPPRDLQSHQDLRLPSNLLGDPRWRRLSHQPTHGKCIAWS